MVSIGGSAQELINQSISNRLGKNLLVVQPGQQSSSGGISFSFSSVLNSLTDADYDAIMKVKEGNIANISRRQIASFKLSYGNQEEDSLVFVIDPGYFKIIDLPLQSGRYFRASSEGSRETIISESTKNRFFKLQDPVGKKITLQGYEFTIVGVVEDAAGTFGGGDTFETYLDTKTYRDVYRKADRVQSILFTAANENAIPELKTRIDKVLRAERKILPSEKSDFTITTQAEIIETSNTILGTVTLFISVISAISLVVGGIGVMNIMLVSVKERVKEIGLRKAIGATNQAIQTQILIESVLFSLIGGILGIIIGSTGAIIIEQVGGLPLYVSVSAIITSLGVSSVVGIVFGLYPAIQAGRLSPIEALRSN